MEYHNNKTVLYNADSTSNFRPTLVYEVQLPQGLHVTAEKSGRVVEGNRSRKLITSTQYVNVPFLVINYPHLRVSVYFKCHSFSA